MAGRTTENAGKDFRFLPKRPRQKEAVFRGAIPQDKRDKGQGSRSTKEDKAPAGDPTLRVDFTPSLMETFATFDVVQERKNLCRYLNHLCDVLCPRSFTPVDMKTWKTEIKHKLSHQLETELNSQEFDEDNLLEILERLNDQTLAVKSVVESKGLQQQLIDQLRHQARQGKFVLVPCDLSPIIRESGPLFSSQPASKTPVGVAFDCLFNRVPIVKRLIQYQLTQELAEQLSRKVDRGTLSFTDKPLRLLPVEDRVLGAVLDQIKSCLKPDTLNRIAEVLRDSQNQRELDAKAFAPFGSFCLEVLLSILDKFEGLETLRLSECHRIPGEILAKLMDQSLNLTVLEIDNCSSCTKQVLEEGTARLHKLDRLRLNQLPRINGGCIENLIAQNPSLRSIEISNCDQIHLEDLETLAPVVGALDGLRELHVHHLPLVPQHTLALWKKSAA